MVYQVQNPPDFNRHVMTSVAISVIVHENPDHDPGEAEEVRSPALRGRMQGPVLVMFTVSEVSLRSPHAP